MIAAEKPPYDYYGYKTDHGSKERIDQIARDMFTYILNSTSFGDYCHEGRDLTSDYLSHSGVALDDDQRGELEQLADNIVWEVEGSNCGYCNYDEGEHDE